jgi:hypothetical protein
MPRRNLPVKSEPAAVVERDAVRLRVPYRPFERLQDISAVPASCKRRVQKLALSVREGKRAAFSSDSAVYRGSLQIAGPLPVFDTRRTPAYRMAGLNCSRIMPFRRPPTPPQIYLRRKLLFQQPAFNRPVYCVTGQFGIWMFRLPPLRYCTPATTGTSLPDARGHRRAVPRHRAAASLPSLPPEQIQRSPPPWSVTPVTVPVPFQLPAYSFRVPARFPSCSVPPVSIHADIPARTA